MRALVAASAMGVLLAGAALAGPVLPHAAVSLQGLDKVTARITPLEATVDQEVTFGTLAIRLRACLTAPPSEPPESAAFLEIDDVAKGGQRRLAFSGWMYASSPGLAALDHAIYDVWVLECVGSLDEPPPDQPPAAGPEPAAPAPEAVPPG